MAVFRKYKGINIKYSHLYPQKALPYPERCILRKNPFKGVGCSLIKEPPKNEHTSRIKMHGKITYLGSRNPWTDRYKMLHAEWNPGHNHACQFLWRSLKRFWCGEGSNFPLFHWVASSPLKHSRTTARVCDLHLFIRAWQYCTARNLQQFRNSNVYFKICFSGRSSEVLTWDNRWIAGTGNLCLYFFLFHWIVVIYPVLPMAQ